MNFSSLDFSASENFQPILVFTQIEEKISTNKGEWIMELVSKFKYKFKNSLFNFGEL